MTDEQTTLAAARAALDESDGAKDVFVGTWRNLVRIDRDAAVNARTEEARLFWLKRLASDIASLRRAMRGGA